MKKLLINLSLTLAAAVVLTACGGQVSGRGVSSEAPGDASAVSAALTASTSVVPAPTAKPDPTAAPTPTSEPKVLARSECYPQASMEGPVQEPSWTEYRYTPDGLLAEEVSGPLDGEANTRVEYTYDDQGYLVTEVQSSLVDGAWQVEFTNEYVNDDYGNCLTWTSTSNAGIQSTRSYTYEYDEQGRWVRQDQPDPTFPMWSTREYSGEGQACTESLYYPGGKLRMVSTYDGEGRLLREEDVDNGEVCGLRERTYDDQGGLICYTVDYDSMPNTDLNHYTNEYAPLSEVLAETNAASE